MPRSPEMVAPPPSTALFQLGQFRLAAGEIARRLGELVERVQEERRGLLDLCDVLAYGDLAGEVALQVQRVGPGRRSVRRGKVASHVVWHFVLLATETRRAGLDGGRTGVLQCSHRGRHRRPGQCLGLVRAASFIFSPLCAV